MEKIDEKLDQGIYNSKVRAEVRQVIEEAIIDAKGEGFIAGYNKSQFMNIEHDKLNTNKEG